MCDRLLTYSNTLDPLQQINCCDKPTFDGTFILKDGVEIFKKGSISFLDGVTFKGTFDFVASKYILRRGLITDENKITYGGQFRYKDGWHSLTNGIIIYPNGDNHTGIFDCDKINKIKSGKVYEENTGITYMGDFNYVNGCRQFDRGTLTYSSGRKASGKFEYHGIHPVLISGEKEDLNGDMLIGVFEYNDDIKDSVLIEGQILCENDDTMTGKFRYNKNLHGSTIAKGILKRKNGNLLDGDFVVKRIKNSDMQPILHTGSLTRANGDVLDGNFRFRNYNISKFDTKPNFTIKFDGDVTFSDGQQAVGNLTFNTMI